MKKKINDKHSAFRIPHSSLIEILLFFLWLGLAGGVSAAAEIRPLAPEWRQALKPMAAMPVEDAGFVRSAYAFAENRLLSLTGRRSWRGMDALETVLYLMADTEAARHDALLHIERPELVRLYGAARISLAQFHDPPLQDKLSRLVEEYPDLLRAADELQEKADRLESLEKDFAIVPRAAGEWLAPAGLDAPGDRAIEGRWQELKKALRANDAQAGAQAAKALSDVVLATARARGIKLPRLKLDVFYHVFQPFAQSALCYLLAALAFGAALLGGRPRVGRAGNLLLALGLAAQLLGIGARWLLAGRAPLANMYESFTFAIAGMILVALILEWVHRTGLAGLGAGVLGFFFMVLAQKAPIFDSRINPLMPALQSSWLTYHVVTIMLSYSAFALSCFVSLIYLIKDGLGGDGAAGPLARRLPALPALDWFNYKIIVVGFPLLTLGIVFGAVWASTAWGRPWGFDPKETWSAITWLIYAIYLHARHLAGWKGRRAALLSLLGFICVLFTYVGVNYLLPGLHSYAN